MLCLYLYCAQVVCSPANGLQNEGHTEYDCFWNRSMHEIVGMYILRVYPLCYTGVAGLATGVSCGHGINQTSR